MTGDEVPASVTLLKPIDCYDCGTTMTKHFELFTYGGQIVCESCLIDFKRRVDRL